MIRLAPKVSSVSIRGTLAKPVAAILVFCLAMFIVIQDVPFSLARHPLTGLFMIGLFALLVFGLCVWALLAAFSLLQSLLEKREMPLPAKNALTYILWLVLLAAALCVLAYLIGFYDYSPPASADGGMEGMILLFLAIPVLLHLVFFGPPLLVIAFSITVAVVKCLQGLPLKRDANAS